ncbi:hypothetical protein KQX54_013110 [Cotesia glomerata]|uniref:Uncharacterized protein n=1 Tax=Cotesia glomerata TaxID=32391 RepID=A0AAV7IHS5_COTGL|nr:hypothetical protein KQX54_013110 [Cotesia glomerata]
MSCDKNTEATPVCSKDNCQCQGALVGANLCHGALHAYSELQTLGFCNSEVRWKPNFCQGVQNANPIHHLLGGCKNGARYEPNFRTLRAHSTLMSLEDFSGSVPCESNVKNNVSENVKENVSENVSNKVLHVQPEFKSLRDCVSGVRCELVLENTLEDCQAISEKRNSDSSNDNDSTRKRTKSNYYEIRKILLIVPLQFSYTKDKLSMRKDNIIQLISADCTFIPKSSRELLNQGKFSIENLLENPGNLGEVIATRWNQNYILHLIVQNTKNERPKIDTVENCISALKIVMEQLGIKTASLSKGKDEYSRNFWALIENNLRDKFANENYEFTICSGEIHLPPPNERMNIIREYHNSVVGAINNNKTKVVHPNKLKIAHIRPDINQDISENEDPNEL